MSSRLHAFAKGKTSNLYQSNTAVAYTRVSTKEQADNNQSLTTQSNQIQQYAQRQGIKIIEQPKKLQTNVSNYMMHLVGQLF